MMGEAEVKCDDPHDGAIMDICVMITGESNECTYIFTGSQD